MANNGIGMLILLIGIVIMIATEIVYGIFDIWEIQVGLVLGMIVMLIGMIILGIELNILNFKGVKHE